MKKEVLVVVAHPDDETIWMGGTLSSNNWNVTIVSLCRKHDKDRAPKFLRVCKEYNARCFMSDLEDDSLLEIDVNEVIERINSMIDKSEYDYIFTHGENGEYGHKRHIDVHNAIKKMINDGELKCKKLFFFSYSKRGNECYAKRNSDRFIIFKNLYSINKKRLIQELYGFNKFSFEGRCCKKAEAFNIMTIK